MVSVAEEALSWFRVHARDLPWRHDVGAWPVLISEVMLQQTPVQRVLPVWREWVDRWPTPADLAAESPAEVIRAWGRLGYPRRAMRLQACAGALVERHGGEVPTRLEQMLALPGVGDYTARAVLSFAYGQRHAVIDTNVRRLIARCELGVEDRAVGLDYVEGLLPVPEREAAAASAAMMELGALVCTAKSPSCGDCPLASRCEWLAAGSPAPEVPFRKTQRFAGTDRQVRGLIMAVLRDSPVPVGRQRIDLVWPDQVQRERALTSLLADGLAMSPSADHYCLPDT